MTALLVAAMAGCAAGYWLPLPLSFRVLGPLLVGAGLAAAALAGWVAEVPVPVARALACLAAALLFLARGGAAVHVPGPTAVDGHLGERVTITGRAVSPRPAGVGGQVVRVHPEGLAGDVMVTARGPDEASVGDRVRVTGRLDQLPGLDRAGRPGYAERLESSGVYARMSGQLEVLAPPAELAPDAVAARLRTRLEDGIRAALPATDATVLLGEAVGIRSSLPPNLDAGLVASGLAHVLAISGLKVVVVAGAVSAVAGLAGRRAALLGIVGVAAYTLAGGATPSALRAAFMGSLGLLGRVIRRDTDTVRSLLLVSLAMLAWEPQLAGQASFQYTVLGVAGIHTMAGRWTEALRRRWRSPRLTALAEGVAVTAAAQVATLPLGAHYFHVLPLVAPLANALVLPALPAATWSGLLVGLGPHTVVLAPVAAVGLAAARWTEIVAGALGGLPLAITVPDPGISGTLAYFALLGGALVPRCRLPRALLVGAGALAATVVLVAGSRPDGLLHLDFLVARGPAVLVRAPDGARLLIDGGDSAPAAETEMAAAVPPRLPLLSAPLDAWVLAGSGRAESGASTGVSRLRPTDAFIASGDGAAADEAAASLSIGGTRVRRVGAGQRLSWHGVEISFAGGIGGLAVSVRYGSDILTVLDISDAHQPVQVGRPEVLAIGVGAALPDLSGSPHWVVAQPGRGRRPGLPAGHWISWSTASQGRLSMACDGNGCRPG